MYRIIIALMVFGFGFSYSNFMYDEDDWYIVKSLEQIQSFTETNHSEIIIGTINGIFVYDKLTDELSYDMYLSRDLPSLNIKNIFYDKNTDHVWLYHDEGVSFKSYSSFSYRHLSKSDLIDQGLSFIDDIGSSDNYIWFRRGDLIVALNSFTGKFVQFSYSKSEINNIVWGSSMFGYSGDKIDLSSHYISNIDWSIGYRLNNVNSEYIDYNVFFDEYGDQVIPTVKFTDSNNNTWFGTDRGFVFVSWGRSRKLEHIESGLQGNPTSGVFIDTQNNWWFYDSRNIRANRFNDFSLYDKKNNLLTFWNEYQGKWKNYKTNESIDIQSNDINHISEYANNILIATMSGLLKYDGSWSLLDMGDGLLDNSIEKIESTKSRVFTLTQSGINEINISSFSVMPTEFNSFKNTEIYDIVIIEQDSIFSCKDRFFENIDECTYYCDTTFGDTSICSHIDLEEMIVSTSKGLYSVDLKTDLTTYLHPKSCYQMEQNNLNLFCLDNGVWMINLLQPSDGFRHIVQEENIRNFTLSDNYIWTNLISRVRLMNLDSGESWYYNESDGILGANIYEVGNNQDWIWFLSDKGVSIYNWRKYHGN